MAANPIRRIIDGPTIHKRRSSVRSLIATGIAVLAFPGLALAAEPGAGGGWIGPFAVIAAGVGMAIASGLCGLGQGRAVAAAVEAMGRQPGAAARIPTALIIRPPPIRAPAIPVLGVR